MRQTAGRFPECGDPSPVWKVKSPGLSCTFVLVHDAKTKHVKVLPTIQVQ